MDVIIGSVLGVTVLSLFLLRIYITKNVNCPAEYRLDGKTVIITGASSGIGKATAVECGRRGATVVMACRDRSRGEALVAQIRRKTQNDNVNFLPLDLASFNSVKEFVTTFLKQYGQLDVLINNAGYLGPKALTADGLDYTFTVNYLSHYLLTTQLLSRLNLDGLRPVRVINLVSDAITVAKLEFDDLMWTTGKRRFDIYKAYGQAKLALLLFSTELNFRFADKAVSCFSVHPGSVKSSLQRHWPGFFGRVLRLAATLLFRTPEAGAQTVVYCACAEGIEQYSGRVFFNCKPLPSTTSGPKKDYLDAEKLWNISADMCVNDLKNFS